VLAGLSLEPAEAEVLFQELLRQVGRMLSRFVVHADLSAYNVLYRHGEARLIDFPQAVDALRHPAAYSLLERDLDRLCAWFAKQGVAADAPALARRLWSEELG
jgi:RIO kinase 1